MTHTPLTAMWSRELSKGLHALKRGDFAEARGFFTRAHRAAPGEPLVLYALGREFARDGEFGRAKALLLEAWKADPTLIGAAATLARGLGLEERDFDAATEILDAASQLGIEVATLEIVRGELAIELGHFHEARRCAATALAGDDSLAVKLSAEALLVRADNLEGVALAADEDFEAALFMFRRAQIGDAAWVAPRINTALAFESLGRAEAAFAAVAEALRLEADNADAIAVRARLLFDAGRAPEAADELTHALEVHPEATDLAVLLAEMCAAGGDVETAATILADLLAQDPTDGEAWLNLGRAQLASGAIGAAEECFREALDLDPENKEILATLADLLVRDGRYFEATALAKRAQGLAPTAMSRYVRGSGASSRVRPRPRRRPE